MQAIGFRVGLAVVLVAGAARAEPPEEETKVWAMQEMTWDAGFVQPGPAWWCGDRAEAECFRDRMQCEKREACASQRTANVFELGHADDAARTFYALKSKAACERRRESVPAALRQEPTYVTDCRAVGAIAYPPARVAAGKRFSCFAYTAQNPFDGKDEPGSHCAREADACEAERTDEHHAYKTTTPCEPRDAAYALQSWMSPRNDARLCVDRAACERLRERDGRSAPCVLVK